MVPACRATACVRVRSHDDGVAAHRLREGIDRIQAELGVTPDFPAEVEQAAAAAAAAPRLPDLDRTDLPLADHRPGVGSRTSTRRCTSSATARDGGTSCTTRSPTSLRSSRRATRSTRRRTGAARRSTAPESRVPLHPPVLSEDAASLLPDRARPALLWTIRLDEDGGGHRRARRAGAGALARPADLRRRRRPALDDGSARETLRLLAEVGELRLAREAARGGVSLPAARAGGRRRGRALARWSSADCCRWRTGTPRSPCSPASARRTSWSTRASGCCARCRRPTPATCSGCTAPPAPWASSGPPRCSTPTSSAPSTPASPTHAAMVDACTRLLRGSGYVALRRRGARASRSTPRWPRSTPTSPPRCAGSATGTPARSASRCAPAPRCRPGCSRRCPACRRRCAPRRSARGAYERGVLDLVEAGVLEDRVGEVFAGVVVDVDEKEPQPWLGRRAAARGRGSAHRRWRRAAAGHRRAGPAGERRRGAAPGGLRAGRGAVGRAVRTSVGRPAPRRAGRGRPR